MRHILESHDGKFRGTSRKMQCVVPTALAKSPMGSTPNNMFREKEKKRIEENREEIREETLSDRGA